MSNEVMQVSLAVIALLGIIVNGIFSYLARNAAKEAKTEAVAAKTEALAAKEEVVAVKTEVVAVVKKVDEYHKEVNGMKTQLVEEVRGRGQAEGEKKGAEDNQAKTDAKEQDKK